MVAVYMKQQETTKITQNNTGSYCSYIPHLLIVMTWHHAMLMLPLNYFPPPSYHHIWECHCAMSNAVVSSPMENNLLHSLH